MYRKFYDLALVAVLTIVAVVLALAGVKNVLILISFGLPLVLFLPGYTLTLVLFEAKLGKAEKLLFSVGLSLLVTIVSGLLLNVTPWGLQAGSWAVWLGAITLGTAGIALVRRLNLPGSTAPQAGFKVKWFQPVLLGIAGLIAVVALLVARNGAAAVSDNFTQLWAIPSAQTGQNSLRLGISNQEAAAVKYRLQVNAGTSLIKEWPSLELAAGQEWETNLPLLATQTGNASVNVRLYRLDAPDKVYRQVFLAPKNSVFQEALR